MPPSRWPGNPTRPPLATRMLDSWISLARDSWIRTARHAASERVCEWVPRAFGRLGEEPSPRPSPNGRGGESVFPFFPLQSERQILIHRPDLRNPLGKPVAGLPVPGEFLGLSHGRDELFPIA